MGRKVLVGVPGGALLRTKNGVPIKSKSKMGESATALFDKVAVEVMNGHRAVFDSLSVHEQKQVIEWLSDALVDGNAENMIHDVLWEVDFIRKPVDIDTFLTDPDYLGKSCGELHENWMRDLHNVFALGSPVAEWIATGCIGSGKGLSVDEPVLTPSGWKRNGDLKVGDLVIGSNGQPTRVTGVFPRGVIPVYRVRFDDDATVVVDGDHLWNVRSPSAQHQGLSWKTVSTRELLKNGVAKGSQKKWHIPILSSPVQYNHCVVPLSAYALGALLGDGGLTGGSIILSSSDPEIIEDVCCETGLVWNYKGQYDYTLSFYEDGVAHGRSNPVLSLLRELGCCTLSHEKRIPAIYLRASIRDRIELLRGLMDTDGGIEGGRATFSTSSPGLADDVVELVRSLGGVTRRTKKATHYLKDGTRIPCRDAHRLTLITSFNPFRLLRKHSAWRPNKKYVARRMIKSVSPAGTADVVCIQVEAADQLYTVKDFIVTHNTTVASAGLAYKLYYLSCMRDPARYYGLLSGSKIVFGVYSVTKIQAGDSAFYKMLTYLDASPYFLNVFKRNMKKNSRVEFLSSPMEVVPGSRELHAIGLDLFSVCLSEGTLVRTDSGNVPVECLDPALHKVMTPTGASEFEAVLPTGAKDCVEVTTEAGAYTVSTDHLIAVRCPEGITWVKARDLVIGDDVVAMDEASLYAAVDAEAIDRANAALLRVRSSEGSGLFLFTEREAGRLVQALHGTSGDGAQPG